MEPYERVKIIRKEYLHLNQGEFADAIGISRANVANIEVGRITLTDRNMKIICDVFGVNLEWLQDGTGPIFRKLTKEEEISNFLGAVVTSDKDFKKRLIRALARLDDDGWDVMEKFIDDITKKED